MHTESIPPVLRMSRKKMVSYCLQLSMLQSESLLGSREKSSHVVLHLAILDSAYPTLPYPISI